MKMELGEGKYTEKLFDTKFQLVINTSLRVSVSQECISLLQEWGLRL